MAETLQRGLARDHEEARALVQVWREGERPWFLTWVIAYEFLRVSTHPAVFPEFRTTDADFHRLSFLEVVNPLVPGAPA